ncbi:IS200/IS605 family transposase [Candidatus Peregrinibacteria bacterium]|nr:MAG: IS200/IS605 family transposase [Candidatus Peregrinibacteria bacterium]QQR54424.1 MAG: IS200/IS605 family transposase [Candidatus Peregrinibacteria bacterium]QQR55146.1 MAG: IS200/IS605 family transposase [Candidatus Peregrinibacteria bacterium]QQR55322.1 MAG: IS200/IS605 family transposase [Candidatus Peregrinibacteria bacterium]QQR55357.1 MAG: IS200/IS605 family transposase [Candidatus Peregrinibacteria bacterium]
MKKLRKSSHAVFICDYHLVWPTKYRRKIFNEGVLAFLQEVMKDIPKYYPELVVKEVNTDLDHVHILISIPPQIAVGEVVRIIKANTARELNIKFPFLRKVYWGTRSIWSAGYFASTVGINEEVIRKYIQQQGEEDAGQAQLELG